MIKIPTNQFQQRTLKVYKKRGKKIIKVTEEVAVFPDPEVFPRSIFQELLDQDDCTSIKIYYGINKKGRMHFAFVGVDSKDQDIVDES